MYRRFLPLVSQNINILSWFVIKADLDKKGKRHVAPWRKLCDYCNYASLGYLEGVLKRAQCAGIDTSSECKDVSSQHGKVLKQRVKEELSKIICDLQSALLFRCSLVGDLDVVRSLVSDGVDVNAKVGDWTALMVSAHRGHANVVEYLVKAGADTNAQNEHGQSALLLSTSRGRGDIVEYLVKAGADVNVQNEYGLSALLISVTKGQDDIVKFLVKAGADVNARNKDGRSALWISVYQDKLGMAKYLVNAGADINVRDKDGGSALLISTARGQADIVKYLVKAGADVNARDKDGQSALLISTGLGHDDIVRYLVEAGADVNVRHNYGHTPLWLSALHSHNDIVKCLVEAGADVNAKCKWNKTPLSVFSCEGRADMVKYLVEAGADINAEVDDSLELKASALMMASVYGHTETVQAFIDAGADVNASVEYWSIRMNVLNIAALTGYKDVFLALRKAGATENRDRLMLLLGECIEAGHAEVSQLIGNLVAENDVGKLRAEISKWFQKTIRDTSIWNIDILRTLLLLSDRFKLPVKIRKTCIPFQDIIFYGSPSALCQQGKLLTDAIILPEDVTHLPKVSELINCPGVGNVNSLPNNTNETISKFTGDVVREMVDKLNEKVGYSQLGMGAIASVKNCGSAAEGTKTVMPDEFDYFIKFKTDEGSRSLGQVLTFLHYDTDNGYKLYSPKGSNKPVTPFEVIVPLLNGSRIFHNMFFDSLLNSGALQHQNVEERLSDYLMKGGGQANTLIKIIWTEPETKNKLRISVDLVPVLHFDNEWPDYLIQKTWLMDREMLKSRGFCLVAKPPHADSALGKSMRVDNLEYERTQLWRISFPHLETEHIANLPARIRDVYVAAKCLRNPDVCRIMFKDKDGILNNVEKYVTSYMLKTVFLHNVENFLKGEKSLIEMVDILYRELEGYLEDGFLPLFWQPSVNNLVGMKGDTKKSLRVVKLMREFVGHLKTREMNRDLAGSGQDDMAALQTRLEVGDDGLQYEEDDVSLFDLLLNVFRGKKAPLLKRPPSQCLPALCPLGYYVFPEDDGHMEDDKSSGG